MSPGSCSRVSAIVLEELELDFESRVVRFMKGEHKSAEYKVHNPKGKVPALIHNGKALTENVAIITYLQKLSGQLLPKTHNELEYARQIADLCFCSSTLPFSHPN